MLTLLSSEQTWTAVQDAATRPHVQTFLSSVDQFVSNLNSARVEMERTFQLQQVELPDVLSQLISPTDYTAAGRKEVASGRCHRVHVAAGLSWMHDETLVLLSANDSELVERLEGGVSVWTNQIRRVLTESEQMRKEADDVGPSAELQHWKQRMVTFNR